MTREFKFRAYNKRDKVMINWENVKRIFTDNNSFGLSDGNLVYFDTVMQWTGLKDKKGVDVYEGDILRYNYHLTYDDNWKGSRENPDFFGVVEYHDKILEIGYEQDRTRFVGFILRGIEKDGTDWFTTIPTIKDIQVIGNIYQNKDLLK